MSYELTELRPESSIELYELNDDEVEHVAGGPEVENDPGQ